MLLENFLIVSRQRDSSHSTVQSTKGRRGKGITNIKKVLGEGTFLNSEAVGTSHLNEDGIFSSSFRYTAKTENRGGAWY